MHGVQRQSALQQVLRAIATDAIRLDVGERLPTGTEYQRLLGAGAGTVQKALSVLVAADALAVASRGHQGRQIVDRDIGRLWALSGEQAVRWMLPPPGSIEGYGLVDAVVTEHQRLDVPVELWYRRGAANRADAVLTGEADAAVMSRGAARDLEIPTVDNELMVTDLGPDTYYPDGSISVLTRAGHDLPDNPSAVRVGIDRASNDHVRLTEAEFPPECGYQYIECDFPRIPVAVAEGRIDTGIWHRMLLLLPLHLAGVASAPLQTPTAQKTRDELSGAVVVSGVARRPHLTGLLKEIDLSTVRRRQEQLLGLDERSQELTDQYWFR